MGYFSVKLHYTAVLLPLLLISKAKQTRAYDCKIITEQWETAVITLDTEITVYRMWCGIGSDYIHVNQAGQFTEQTEKNTAIGTLVTCKQVLDYSPKPIVTVRIYYYQVLDYSLTTTDVCWAEAQQLLLNEFTITILTRILLQNCMPTCILTQTSNLVHTWISYSCAK